jgi:SMC interacting uncharacterized protein involved in chromosome segregation
MANQADKTQVSLRIALRQKAELEAEAAERGISLSQYIRDTLAERQRVPELERRLERKQPRIDELERQLGRRSDIEDKIDELPTKMRQEESKPDAPFFVQWWRWFRD